MLNDFFVRLNAVKSKSQRMPSSINQTGFQLKNKDKVKRNDKPLEDQTIVVDGVKYRLIDNQFQRMNK